jgi:hypothetical protein
MRVVVQYVDHDEATAFVEPSLGRDRIAIRVRTKRDPEKPGLITAHLDVDWRRRPTARHTWHSDEVTIRLLGDVLLDLNAGVVLGGLR